MTSSHPKNVGILALDIYFPPTCVLQEALEVHDGVSKGKYTVGLGQDCMAFCSEVEDVISMSLTVVTSLLEKYKIDPTQIGRLEVGSETVIDKSKSIKTFLMQIFEKYGNTDIEGVDSTNACYGGTAALFNCVNWVESASWDGRYGLVVCTDSAVYAEGPARPTGGAAAVAMLIGPDAPIAFESKLRGSHMSHAYDFYKPNLASEYPVVDGKLSQTCYLMALDSCYKYFCQKFEKLEGRQFSMLDVDYFVFHSPYNKEGKRVIMFSYGSGLTATMFSLQLQEGHRPFSLSNIVKVMDVPGKLKLRHEFPPEKFVDIMKLMEHRYGAKDFVTSKDSSLLSPGTCYLTEVDSMFRRFYAKKENTSNAATCENGARADFLKMGSTTCQHHRNTELGVTFPAVDAFSTINK
ncbi:hypothetical protein CUMW_058170 [Citrus unshiu]|nr:hypothetical protein CUMW_058170 [Citrus unshiu]